MHEEIPCGSRDGLGIAGVTVTGRRCVSLPGVAAAALAMAGPLPVPVDVDRASGHRIGRDVSFVHTQERVEVDATAWTLEPIVMVVSVQDERSLERITVANEFRRGGRVLLRSQSDGGGRESDR